MARTRDGRAVVIETLDKPGMSIFKMFGKLDGKPCHWTAEGRFRADGRDDPRDIVDNEFLEPREEGSSAA